MAIVSEQLELDAIRALVGADEVRHLVSSGLVLGNPSVESIAYMVKSRIKEHEKIVQKVFDRRKKGKPHYAARDVTDIVGLRLLALFRNEVPSLLRQFLVFVEFSRRSPLNLIVGDTLEDAFREIVVYRTSRQGDTTDRLITREFQRLGLSCAFVPEGKSPDKVRAKVKIVTKPSEYSSVHILLRCNHKRSPRRFTVPLEIQIRSAFEDVWGEIEHRLKYKRRLGGEQGLTDLNRHYYELASQQLVLLKQQMDTASGIADTISDFTKLIFSGASYGVKREIVSSASVDTHKLMELELPTDSLMEELKRAAARINGLFASMLESSTLGDTKRLVEVIIGFVDAATDLKSIHDSTFAASRIRGTRAEKITYYLRMERALCLYWAERLKTLNLPHRDLNEIPSEIDQDFAEQALREYFDLQHDQQFERDPILAFRIGNVLALRGNSELALDMYQDAVKYLERSKLPDDHNMRMKIPRFLGVALWDQAEHMKYVARRAGDLRAFSDVRRRLYLQAIDVTKSVIGKATRSGESDWLNMDSATDNAITINNILEYCVAFLGAQGTWRELTRHGISKNRFCQYLEALAGRLTQIDRPTVADTIRAAAALLGREALANRAARRVLALMPRQDLWVSLSRTAYEEMREDALAQLRKARTEAKSAAAVRKRPASGRLQRKKN